MNARQRGEERERECAEIAIHGVDSDVAAHLIFEGFVGEGLTVVSMALSSEPVISLLIPAAV